MSWLLVLLAVWPFEPATQDRPAPTLETVGLPAEPVLVEVAGGWRELTGPVGWNYESAAFVGDLDGDGTGDLALACNRSGWCNLDTHGRLELVSGATGRLIGIRSGGDVSFQVLGAPPDGPFEVWNESAVGSVRARAGALGPELWSRGLQDSYGFAPPPVRAVGDVDGDGTVDLVACESWAFTLPKRRTEQTAVLRSGDGGEIVWSHADPRRDFGQDAAPAGDVDGDGRPDVAILSKAALTVLSGADGSVLEERPLTPFGAGNELRLLGPAGDLDLDGRADLVVEGEHGGLTRRPLVLSGATLEPLEIPGGEVPGGAVAFQAPAGDLDGDGHGDLVLGLESDERALAVHSGGALHEVRRWPADAMDWSDVRTQAIVGRLEPDGPWHVVVTTRGASWQDEGRSRVLLIPGR